MPSFQLIRTSTPASSSTAASKLPPTCLLPLRPLPSWAHRSPPVTSVPRRLILSSAYSICNALTGDAGGRAGAASTAVRRGMILFRQGNVSGSLTEFDRAIALNPSQKAYLWQRGLSLYYLNRFEDGAAQFRLDVANNPNDTEESIWCFLCEAQIYGVDEARNRFLEVGPDSRAVMREAYNMFKDGGDPKKLVSSFTNAGEIEVFYASLYAGLYYESQNEMDAAKLFIVAACQTPYGEKFMLSLSRSLSCYVRKFFNITGLIHQLPMVIVAGLMIIWPP